MTATESTASDSMVARVERLLEQAQQLRAHGEDDHADVALARAQDIMLKHSIDAATLAARRADGVRNELQVLSLPFDGIYRIALAPAFYDLVVAYGGAVRPILQRGKNVYAVNVVGPEDELQRVRTLATSIRLQAFGALEYWWTRYDGRFTLSRMKGYKARRQFLRSFIDGVIQRLKRARRTALDDAEPGTEIAVRDRCAVVDAFFDEHFNVRKIESRVDGGGVAAALAGLTAGSIASTDEPAVATDRLQLEA